MSERIIDRFRREMDEHFAENPPEEIEIAGVRYRREGAVPEGYEAIEAGERIDATGNRFWYERGHMASVKVVKILVPTDQQEADSDG